MACSLVGEHDRHAAVCIDRAEGIGERHIVGDEPARAPRRRLRRGGLPGTVPARVCTLSGRPACLARLKAHRAAVAVEHDVQPRPGIELEPGTVRQGRSGKLSHGGCQMPLEHRLREMPSHRQETDERQGERNTGLRNPFRSLR